MKIEDKIEEIRHGIGQMIEAHQSGSDYGIADWGVSLDIKLDELSTLIEKEKKKAYNKGKDDGIKMYEDLARYIQAYKKKFITSQKGEDDSYMYEVDGTMSPEDH